MAKIVNTNKANNKDTAADYEIAAGHDPFNGEVYLFWDGHGYWIENWRTDHYSDYLQDENGKLIKDEAQAIECWQKEISNAQFVGAIYP